MRNQEHEFRDSFVSFVIDDFSNFRAPWRLQTQSAFLQISLTEEQINFLLDDRNATSQFRSDFLNALKSRTHPPQVCIAATTTEPINKIGTYFQLARDDEELNDAVLKAANVLPIVCRNFELFLDGLAPDEATEIYQRLDEFAQAASAMVYRKGLKPIDDMKQLEGMHHIAALPVEIFARH